MNYELLEGVLYNNKQPMMCQFTRDTEIYQPRLCCNRCPLFKEVKDTVVNIKEGLTMHRYYIEVLCGCKPAVFEIEKDERK